MRAAQNQANSAEQTANATGAGYGSDAANISSTLTPFLTRELNNPGGISQQDQTAMLSASEGGAGGLAGGLATQANEKAAATGNASGFGSGLDDIARERMKAAAGGAENIASQNSQEKLNQQQQGAQGLAGLYGKDTGAQLGSMGIQTGDINAEVKAGQSGWLQNLQSIIGTIRGFIPGTPAAVPGGGGPATDSTDTPYGPGAADASMGWDQ